MVIEAIQEGIAQPPRLRLDINVGTLANLPSWSEGPELGDFAAVRAAGYEGLQGYAPERAAVAAGLKMTGMARILDPDAVDVVAKRHADWGFEATTLHVGDGFESDAEMDVLAAAVLEGQARRGHPLFVETHRATMTQDIRRTLDLVERFPDLRFNADLSHWYTGHEMTYGDLQRKFERLTPVLSRVRFVHGRIGNSCTMQAPLRSTASPPDYVGHFKDLWIRCFRGFRAAARSGDIIVFAPELLPAEVEFHGRTHHLHYAHLCLSGQEETDRWTEALALCRLAEDAWAESCPDG